MLRSSETIDIAVPDFRHWYHDDQTFQEYVDRLSSVRFKIFCLFEDPLGFERPQRIPSDLLIRKLSERVSKLASAIKEKHPTTILLSPAVGYNSQDTGGYLDFFIDHRHFFDGYAVHCCNDLTEYSLGRLTTLLNQVMNVLPKKIWVTKWAVPCFDGKIHSTKIIGPSGWEPYTSDSAVIRLHRSFDLIESIARVGSHWFYVGTGTDAYAPRQIPGMNDCWSYNFPTFPEDISYSWKYWHFLGLVAEDGHPKTKLLDALIRLARSKNA